MTQTTTIVGITGASGSGKTFLANRLLESLREHLRLNELPLESVAQLTEDSYYRRQDDLAMEARVKTNYDHPSALEHDLLVSHLQELRAGTSIEVPTYDYSKHTRKPETKPLNAPRLLILEGILVLHVAELRDLVDLKIFVDVPLDICLERRIERDSRERGRTRESVIEQFERTVRPMFTKFTLPTREQADLIVPMAGDCKTAVDVLSDHLIARLK